MSVFSEIFSKYPINNCVITGASITDSPWFTWADFLIESTQLPTQNFSARGAGNEYMIASLIKNQERINQNSLVAVMLTNNDKFDWYVDSHRYQELQNEKHRPKSMSEHSGFWCTGSWFPLVKDTYKNLFYSHDYSCARSVQQIMLLWQFCQSKQCSLLILFDSPIWNYTEQLINKIGQDALNPMTQSMQIPMPYFELWKPFLHSSLINNHDSSLLGFCWTNRLAWYNKKLKGHPPSSSHYMFFNQIVRPRLQDFVKLHDIDQLTDKIQKFDKLWNLADQ